MSTPPQDTNAELIGELRTTLATLNTTVNALVTAVADIEKRLRFVWGAALLVVGAVGGPSAVTAVLGH